MTQLDKLEMLNSQWKAFANCQSEGVKDYAKSVMMYMMSKGRITQLETVTANKHSITLSTKRNNKGVNVFIYGDNDCDILFHDGRHTHNMRNVTYFGLSEIIIEMYFAEGKQIED